jgi:hypothetical protein
MPQLAVPVNKSVVIDPEKLAEKEISQPKHFFFQCDIEAGTTGLNTFLILRIETLNKYAPLLIKAIKDLPKLQIVFLLGSKSDLDSFLDYLKDETSSVKARIFDVLHVPTSKEQVNLMMHARCDGSEDQFIARAHVMDDELTLTSFGLNSFKAKFDAIPILKNLPSDQRSNFKILDHGKRIEWKDFGVNIDLEDFRYHTNKSFRTKQNLQALNVYGMCGQAVKRLRGELSQQAIEKLGGPSTKQLGRIENMPTAPTLPMLAKLAKAHGVSFEEYLKKLLKTSETLESEQIEAFKKKQKAKK